MSIEKRSKRVRTLFRNGPRPSGPEPPKRKTGAPEERKVPAAVRAAVALLLGLSAVAAAVPVARAMDPPRVLLNEILADPASDWDGDGTVNARDDEWLEIVNAGSSSVDLSEFQVSSPDTCWRFAFSGTLGPGDVALVTGSESYAWEEATGNPRYGLRLGNSGGEILLWRISGSDSTIVDRYTYEDHEADDDRSTGRAPDGADTWRLFDAMNPHTGTEVPQGTNCMPSPGALLSCPTPVEDGTWGEIKQKFR